jgi:hypothetical protein
MAALERELEELPGGGGAGRRRHRGRGVRAPAALGSARCGTRRQGGGQDFVRRLIKVEITAKDCCLNNGLEKLS